MVQNADADAGQSEDTGVLKLMDTDLNQLGLPKVRDGRRPRGSLAAT